MNINFQYPTWFFLFCLAAGLAYAMVLYFKDHTFREKSKVLNLGLGIFRFLTVSLLSFLLLSPFLKSLVRETKKPIVIFAQDNSESIRNALGMDSTEYSGKVNAMLGQLSSNYELKSYSFGSKVREGIDYAFDDKESNLSDVLEEIYDLYSNQNLGAIVLATDGIYNQGKSPLYTGTKLSVPVYTIALGDTTRKKDLSIKKVYHNKIAYLGDRFSIQVDIGAINCNGSKSSINVFKIEDSGSKKLITEPFNINKSDFFSTNEIILDADQTGVQRFRISLNGVSGEETLANNSRDIFVEVLDTRQKILLVANSPHPDISALKQTISLNKNYEVDIAYINDIRTDPGSYDLVVLHQLPGSRDAATGLMRQLNTRKVPRLFIVGSQSNLPAFNQSQSMMEINGDGRNTNEAQAILGQNFSLFNLDDRVKNLIPKYPPLITPFGNYTVAGDARILLNQKIGSVQTDYPLMVFGETDGIKMAVLAGEGIWKWRVFNFLQQNNHEIFNELINKSVQYLTIKEDKRKFRVSLSKNIFKENEPVLFDAELYNESYQRVNVPEVNLIITNSEGKDFGYTMNKNGEAYSLNAGYFPVGNYRFQAKTTFAGKELLYDGRFSVEPIQLEIFETTANHQLLAMLSDQYGGKVMYPGQIQSLADSIQASGNALPVFYTTTRTRSMINLKWIFFLLIGFLGIEWFFRKFFGAY